MPYEIPSTVSLKTYQTRVVTEVTEYLTELHRQQENTANRHAASDAWRTIQNRRAAQDTNANMGRYGEMETGDERDLPNVCLLVPTGGGKTLLATQVIASALKTLLPEREGTGLVLWLVPTQSIYTQTVAALQDAAHFYHRALKAGVGTRVKVWTKDQIGGLTPLGLRRDLNVFVLMLQSVNRPDIKESLKYFRDGRVLPSHFPAENDEAAHIKLREMIPNLETLDGSPLIRTSLANLVRVCRPIVIVDEQQKAATPKARETLRQLNPALLAQLSATPNQTNILCRVSGGELLREQMIKLPIAVFREGIGDAYLCLDKAHRRQQEIEIAAEKHRDDGGKYIRPIAVVQAERTGKEQRDDIRYVHADDVHKYLTVNLGVPANQIAIKTSETDGLKDIDLLDEACPIRWIITRDALKEGWDCPFAYLLVSLLNSGNLNALTQLVGRVLRQPYQTKTGIEALDQCSVLARFQQTDETIQAVKKSLNDAGFNADDYIYNEGDAPPNTAKGTKTAHIKREFLTSYLDPIPGKILLPFFCHRDDPKTGTWGRMNWYSHLLPGVHDRDFDLAAVDNWRLADDLKNARNRYTLLHIEKIMDELRDEAVPDDVIEGDDATTAWLTVNVDLPHYSIKERARVIARILPRLRENEPSLSGKLALVRYALRDRIAALIETETNRLAQVNFRARLAENRIGFTLQHEPCRYEVPEEKRRTLGRKLRFNDEEPAKHLFDYEPEDDFNNLERDFATTVDTDTGVFWWYRNIVGEFGIQGWRRGRFYPDFVIQMSHDGRAAPAYLMVETKGAQLDGNLNTTYKREVAECFNSLSPIPWQLVRGWENADEDPRTVHHFDFRVLAENEILNDAWKDEWRRMRETAQKRIEEQAANNPRPISASTTLLRK